MTAPPSAPRSSPPGPGPSTPSIRRSASRSPTRATSSAPSTVASRSSRAASRGGEQPSIAGTIRVDSLRTDNEQRDAHLISPDFLDAAKYPEIRFETTAVEPLDDERFKRPRQPDRQGHALRGRARGPGPRRRARARPATSACSWTRAARSTGAPPPSRSRGRLGRQGGLSTMRILGIAGSLRKGSYNRGLLRAARELMPEGVELVEYDIRDLPFYDGDVETAGDPESVVALKDAIREADALLIATPEYNRGVPGGLKNAVDWASRPPLGSPLAGKPVAMMGATTGRGGTALAQQQLREALEFPRAIVLEEPRGARARGATSTSTSTASWWTRASAPSSPSSSTLLFTSRAVLRSPREHRRRADDQRRPHGRPVRHDRGDRAEDGRAGRQLGGRLRLRQR